MKSVYMVMVAVLMSARCMAESAPIAIVLGHSVVDLNGPWKFHTGDDAAWADPNFDDSSWESVDLTAPPGAHDDDVGLTRYVPGWGARGHRNYAGYAWYRLRVGVIAPAHESVALSAPPAVDSAYQVFVNGQLLGGCGRFTGQIPVVFSVQPRVFAISGSGLGGENGSAVIAFRVWMGPWDLGDPAAGGIHIAPSIGTAEGIEGRYQAQWLQTIRGYIVEVVEAAAFFLLAIMAWMLNAFEHVKRPCRWLCAGLVFLGLYRANQGVFNWGQFETVQAFEVISVVLLIPLFMGSWTLAWRGWFGMQDAKWIAFGVRLLTLTYVAAQFVTRSWFYGALPHWVALISESTVTGIRIVFLLLIGWIVYRAIRLEGREAWVALPAIVMVSIGLFAREVSAMGFRGIWFPFGTGVSRTQFAYAAFDVVLFGLLARRFALFARGHAADEESVRF